MSEQNKVVVHFLSGEVIKGTTQDFMPNRPKFHLQPLDGSGAVEVACDKLKAVFFVRDYGGRPERKGVRGFLAAPSDSVHGRKVSIRFRDGELLCGYTLAFSAERSGFMVFPADQECNNLRVYVLARAALEVKAGAAAEAMARRLTGEAAA